MVKTLLILGSTGSIGKSTLEVVRQHRDKFKVKSLVANTDVKGIAQQAIEFEVEVVALADQSKFKELQTLLAGTNVRIEMGREGILNIAKSGHDIVVSAIVGVSGLEATYASIPYSKTLALANKETLICSGRLLLESARSHGTQVIPVDSEHSAIFQTFERGNFSNIKKITLTASGGAFRELSIKQMAEVTPEMAIKHPNWNMGPKITVDCATLMNKGLEVIEACQLFELSPKQIEVVIHRESIIHGITHYEDGSSLAHLSLPDMKTPIVYAMSYPERLKIKFQELKLWELGVLHFEEPNYNKFPLLKCAYQALEADSQADLIKLNTANEVAVSAFLNNKIKFLDIVYTAQWALENINTSPINSIADALNYSEVVKIKTAEFINTELKAAA